ncbi:MAG: S8 family serine peptidase [Solirubrobacterales bacterium]
MERPAALSAPPTLPATLSANRVIVEWAPGASHADRVDAREGAEVTSMRRLGDPAFQLVEVGPRQSADDVLAALRSNPAVKVASRDGYSALDALPDDPLLDELWGLRNLGSGIDGFGGAIAGDDIGAPAAWDRTIGIPSTTIADLDSGYRFTDPDLGPVAWANPGETPGNEQDDDHNGYVDDVRGYDFVGASSDSPSSDNDPTDDNIVSGGHGLHTAGTMGAAGDNNIGITGVAQDVRIMPLRVCANSPSHNNEALCPFSSQVAAINYAGEMGARVANMSLGGSTFEPAVRDAIANNPQTLYVISAGNDGSNNDSGAVAPHGHHYPCDYNPLAEEKGAIDNIVCVAATNQADGLAGFSDWGPTSVDLGAPGTETLSTYPAKETRFKDDFETDDFSTNWSATAGADGGFSRTNESPLTSFGMTDSSGVATPVANTVRSSTSVGFEVPTGYGSCVLTQKRNLAVGNGDTFQYFVLSNGSTAFSSGSVSASGTVSTVPITGLAGTTVRVRDTFTAGSAPTEGHGAWIDSIEFRCYEPLSAPLAYEFLQGTSMAAPHVTGAAGLLFSLKPTATVSEVKNALLSSVDPDPALSAKTATGGRLDVAKALDALVPSVIVGPVETVVGELPPGSLAAETTPAGSVSPPPVATCKVPKLAGKTLSKATTDLRAAHCSLGKATRPRPRHGHKLGPLVVKSSNPPPGSSSSSGKVDLTLGPKPKPKKRHH